ncbi:MAG: protein kinase domain-containing protein [Gemmatimonadales bacterium]
MSADEFLDRLRRALEPEYSVDRVIASGGMGTVAAGRDVALDRPVAIKVLRPELTHPAAVARFAREARILARLEHPAIVPVFNVKDDKGLYCVIMRFMPGGTLEQRLEKGPLGLDGVCDLGRDVLEALAAAHRLSIIHRDVKPGNIFLADGRALLGDFGISRSLADEASMERAGVGTPGYAAPEQLNGGTPTTRSDLYSLGIVLYEAFAGHRFFARGLYDRQRWVGIPRRLARALKGAVAWNPDERWPDAAAFAAALAKARRQNWTRTSVVALAAVTLAVLSYRAGRTVPPDLAAQPVDLAILPLESSDAADSAGHQLARYVATQLEWFSPITFRPATFSFGWWDTTSAPHRVSDAPARLNAGRYLEGEIASVGGARVATARVRDRQGRLVQTIRVADAGAGTLAWAQAIADSLVRMTFPDRYRAYRDLGATGGSTDQYAVNAFIAGENAFHRDAYATAEAHFKEAVDLDPRFAVAAWHLALMRRWLRLPFEADLRRLAAGDAERLPPHYRALLSAQLEPDLSVRLAGYRSAIERFPGDGYALLLYADELFHRGPLIGLGLDTALRVMSAAAKKDPYLDVAPALDHLIWGYLRVGDKAGADTAVAQRLRARNTRGGEGSAESSRRLDLLRLAYHERFHPAWAAVLRATLLGHPDAEELASLAGHLRLALLFDIPESERALGAILVRSAPDDAMAAQGHEAEGLALIAMGRPREGISHIDSAAALFGTPAAEVDRAEWRLLPQRLGMPGADPADEAWARSRLATLAADSLLGERASWALALDALLSGRREDAGRWLGGVKSGSLSAVLAGAEAPDASEALSRTESLATREATARPADPFARAALYLLRSRWLASLGRFAAADSALRWYENSDGEDYPQGTTESTDVDAALSPTARVLRGRLALVHGGAATACAGLRRVRELWSGAEPGFTGARAEIDSLISSCPG